MTTIRYGNLQVQLLVTHGTRLDRVQLDTPAPRLRLSGPGQAAAPAGTPLVGRADLLDHLAGLSHPGWAVELRAACGFGKSSLLAALAARLADHAAAPAVHLRVGEQPPDDIPDQLIGALFTAGQPAAPRPRPGPTARPGRSRRRRAAVRGRPRPAAAATPGRRAGRDGAAHPAAPGRPSRTRPRGA